MISTALYFFQEKIIFLPTVLEQDYQYEFNYPFEELYLETADDAKLNAIHFKAKKPKGVILYFHGNAGDLTRWGVVTEFFVEKQYDVLVMDYRTFGKSTGKLNESVFYSDAQLFYNYLKKRYQEKDILVYGRSLGTGIASHLASKNNPRHLVLETPYYSMGDVASYRFPFLPIKKLLKYKFPSYKFIKTVACNITIFHGTDDQVVPYNSAEKLFESAPKDLTTFITIPEGNHGNLIDFELYHSQINKILP